MIHSGYGPVTKTSCLKSLAGLILACDDPWRLVADPRGSTSRRQHLDRWVVEQARHSTGGFPAGGSLGCRLDIRPGCVNPDQARVLMKLLYSVTAAGSNSARW